MLVGLLGRAEGATIDVAGSPAHRPASSPAP
jgi:hypothetical protein